MLDVEIALLLLDPDTAGSDAQLHLAWGNVMCLDHGLVHHQRVNLLASPAKDQVGPCAIRGAAGPTDLATDHFYLQ